MRICNKFVVVFMCFLLAAGTTAESVLASEWADFSVGENEESVWKEAEGVSPKDEMVEEDTAFDASSEYSTFEENDSEVRELSETGSSTELSNPETVSSEEQESAEEVVDAEQPVPEAESQEEQESEEEVIDAEQPDLDADSQEEQASAEERSETEQQDSETLDSTEQASAEEGSETEQSDSETVVSTEQASSEADTDDELWESGTDENVESETGETADDIRNQEGSLNSERDEESAAEEQNGNIVEENGNIGEKNSNTVEENINSDEENSNTVEENSNTGIGESGGEASTEDLPATEPGYIEVSDIVELSETVGSDWDHCFSTAVINPEQNVLTVDGEEADPDEVFGDAAEEAAVTDSLDSALSFFDGSIYETEVQDDGTLEIEAPFQLKRLVVYAENLEDYCGAVTVIHYPKAGEYILEFDTPEQTKAAFEKIRDEYCLSCYPDELVNCELFQSESDSSSWGYQYMGFPNALQKSDSAQCVTVKTAVIDTGINPQNPFFGEGKISDESFDLVNNTYVQTDHSGHGTHIAGIISQCTSDSVELIVIRVFDDDGKTTWLTLNNALQYSIEHDVNVINMSLGITNRQCESTETALNNMLDEAWASGIPVLCASGNEGYEVSHVYPACYEAAIAVSAIDEASVFAYSFSNGSGGSGYGNKIEFCAPGVNISSASGSGGVAVKSGTSCSTAFVSAAFSLLKAESPDYTADKLYEKAVSCTVDLGDEGKDPYYGWGSIRFAAEELIRTPVDISDLTITLTRTEYTYSGKAYKPGIQVSDGEKILIKGTDYKVKYSNNVNAGTAVATIEGTGDYLGTVKRNFTIKKASASIKANSFKRIYNKKSQAFNIKAKCAVPLSYRSDNKSVSVNQSGKVTVKAGFVGRAIITIAVKDLKNFRKATRKIIVKVNPSKTTIKTAARKLQKKKYNVLLKWNRNRSGTGYEIWYSCDSHFKKGIKVLRAGSNSRTSAVIENLKKGKTWYFQIRTYRYVSGVKYVSTWSGKKSVRIP